MGLKKIFYTLFLLLPQIILVSGFLNCRASTIDADMLSPEDVIIKADRDLWGFVYFCKIIEGAKRFDISEEKLAEIIEDFLMSYRDQISESVFFNEWDFYSPEVSDAAEGIILRILNKNDRSASLETIIDKDGNLLFRKVHGVKNIMVSKIIKNGRQSLKFLFDNIRLASLHKDFDKSHRKFNFNGFEAAPPEKLCDLEDEILRLINDFQPLVLVELLSPFSDLQGDFDLSEHISNKLTDKYSALFNFVTDIFEKNSVKSLSPEKERDRERLKKEFLAKKRESIKGRYPIFYKYFWYLYAKAMEKKDFYYSDISLERFFAYYFRMRHNQCYERYCFLDDDKDSQFKYFKKHSLRYSGSYNDANDLLAPTEKEIDSLVSEVSDMLWEAHVSGQSLFLGIDENVNFKFTRLNDTLMLEDLKFEILKKFSQMTSKEYPLLSKYIHYYYRICILNIIPENAVEIALFRIFKTHVNSLRPGYFNKESMRALNKVLAERKDGTDRIFSNDLESLSYLLFGYDPGKILLRMNSYRNDIGKTDDAANLVIAIGLDALSHNDSLNVVLPFLASIRKFCETHKCKLIYAGDDKLKEVLMAGHCYNGNTKLIILAKADTLRAEFFESMLTRNGSSAMLLGIDSEKSGYILRDDIIKILNIAISLCYGYEELLVLREYYGLKVSYDMKFRALPVVILEDRKIDIEIFRRSYLMEIYS